MHKKRKIRTPSIKWQITTNVHRIFVSKLLYTYYT